MYDFNPTTSEIRAAMQTLSDKGIAKVVIEFSGGNDEGGADSISYFDAEGNDVEGVKNPNAYLTQEWDSVRRTVKVTGWQVSEWDPIERRSNYRPATEDEIALAKVNAILEGPIYDRFGSFAGEFSVYGQVIWDVAAGTHTMTGQESHEVWDSFSY